MPKGKTAAPAPVKVTGEAATKARKEARQKGQEAAHQGNLAEIAGGSPTPWQMAKAKRAERRQGMPMSTESRRRLDREKAQAERKEEKSSPSQARRNAEAIAKALEAKRSA